MGSVIVKWKYIIIRKRIFVGNGECPSLLENWLKNIKKEEK